MPENSEHMLNENIQVVIMYYNFNQVKKKSADKKL